jgi:hypothetical protein
MLASGTQDRGFFGRKNPQHAFLWKGSKAGMSKKTYNFRKL